MIPLRVQNPARTMPLVTFGLMSINILAFIYEVRLPPRALEDMIFQMGLIPAEITTPERYGPDLPVVFTLFTSMFLHGSLLHLFGNMLYLWVFGNNIEDATGHFGFLAFYLLCGLAASGTQIAATPFSSTPIIGASGAIAGVLGAYMMLFPGSRVLTLVPIFIFIRLMYLPAVVVLGIWFLYQLLLSSSAGTLRGGGIAFFAHIGGFLAGMLLVWFFRKPPPRPRVNRW